MNTRTILITCLYLPGIAAIVLAVFGPLATEDPATIVAAPYSTPTSDLMLGTDHAGRDVWEMVLAGGLELLTIPVLAVMLTVILGTFLGLSAGYFGKTTDAIISRWDSVALSIPAILIMLVLLHSWGYNSVTMTAAILFASVPFVSRLARASTLQVRKAEYVERAVALGAGPLRVMVTEIGPNIINPVLADAGTRLAVAISLTATAGFLGFTSDTPNWGGMVNRNFEGITLNPWGVLAPALLLAILAVSVNSLLDRLARKLNP